MNRISSPTTTPISTVQVISRRNGLLGRLKDFVQRCAEQLVWGLIRAGVEMSREIEGSAGRLAGGIQREGYREFALHVPLSNCRS